MRYVWAYTLHTLFVPLLNHKGYVFEGTAYPSMQKLVIANAEQQNWKLACPGSKLQGLFNTQPVPPYLGYKESN